jgi:hypothetical protein
VVAVVLVHGDRRNLLILVRVCEGFRVRVLAFPSQRAPIINVRLNFQFRNFRVLQKRNARGSPSVFSWGSPSFIWK